MSAPSTRAPLPWGLELTASHDFLGPREVRIGDGAAAEVGSLVRRWSGDDGIVLLICDSALVGLGLTDAVEGSLAEAGYRVTRFDKVTAEPDVAVAEAAVAVARSAGPVAVVGMGGGSAMDVAKIGAALAIRGEKVGDIVGTDRIPGPGLPLVLVPTTAGTGSEATRVAMLSEAGEKRIVVSPHLVPVGAVLDPLLVSSLPAPVTAATGLDALTHAVESLLSTAASSLTVQMSLDAFELLARALPRAYVDGSDSQARRGTLYGAYLAGLGLNAGVVLGHSIAYTIANRTHLPHGITAAMALPYCLAYNAGVSASELELLVTALPEGSGDLFGWVTALNAQLGVPPSLQALDLSEADADAMAVECLERYPRPTNPLPLTPEALRRLYRHLWRGAVQDCVADLAEGGSR